MVEETLRCLRPEPGDVAIDCTLGGGGHAEAILNRLQPGGRLIGVDVDPIGLPRSEARLRAAGFGSRTFAARHGDFSRLPALLAAERIDAANVIVADLGISTMQADDPERGFSYKVAGPLDMRMNSFHGETAADLLARLTEPAVASLLTENADEPHASLIAGLIKQTPIQTTHALERLVRMGLTAARSDLTKAEVKMAVRRTFQALRIAVNGEFAALDALLAALPHCLAPGGRVAILTFHSGEDRRVKKAFRAAQRAGVYVAGADEIIRSSKAETYANRRAQAAKLRWAVRAPAATRSSAHD